MSAQTYLKLSQRLEDELAKAKREIAELKELVYKDPLTGLFNRRAFDEALKVSVSSSMRHNTSLSLLIIDIDDFKKCNDAFGHFYGDSCLLRLAYAMNACKRSEDIACRFGGEEFALLMPYTNKTDSAQLAARLQATLSTLDDEKCSLTFSGGIAELHNTHTFEELFAQADAAMYRSKEMGKNQSTVWI